jgi:hypothetical protein
MQALAVNKKTLVDLKIGPFKPEYAGKINLYCNIVDYQYRKETDNPPDRRSFMRTSI